MNQTNQTKSSPSLLAESIQNWGGRTSIGMGRHRTSHVGI